MDKLSSISLLSDSLALTEAVPFTPDLETQWDTKITCLPFKTAPFSILDAAKSLKSDQCRVTDVFSLDPSSIRTNLICAYPVLIPLYLAQYTGNATVVLEAHHESGRILEEKGPASDEGGDADAVPEQDDFRTVVDRLRKIGIPPPQPSDGPLTRFLLRSVRYLDERMTDMEKKIDEFDAQIDDLFWYHRGVPTQFVNIAALTIPPTWTRWNMLHFRHFRKWLDFFRTTGTLPTAKNDQMTDPRIRPFTADEIITTRTFLRTGQERAKAHTLLDSMSKVNAAGTPESKNKDLEEYVVSFDAQREKATPKWWKEWLQSTQKS